MSRQICSQRSRGQGIVEFALVLPIFLTLVFGCIDLGRAVFMQSLINNAVRDAARSGIVTQDVSKMEAQLQASAGPLGGIVTPCAAVVYSSTLLTAAPACANSGSAGAGAYGYVTVTAAVPFTPMENLFGTNWNLTLRAQSTMMFAP